MEIPRCSGLLAGGNGHQPGGAGERGAPFSGEWDLMLAKRRVDRQLSLERIREISVAQRGSDGACEAAPAEPNRQRQRGRVTPLHLKGGGILEITDVRAL